MYDEGDKVNICFFYLNLIVTEKQKTPAGVCHHEVISDRQIEQGLTLTVLDKNVS
jgi:hypothetical protein